MRDPYSILERPIISEKSMKAAGEGKYTFKVRKDANKIEIRKAVEKAFNVRVVRVNTLIVKGEMRRWGRRPAGKTPDWKKAIVTLAPGQKIDVFEGV
ncbi:MAG: 50S ribosomal protein L23 [Armatimonadota bacterium]